MNFVLSETTIKQLCGEASYKTGLAYYTGNKVDIKKSVIESPLVEASVTGNGLFDVTIQHDNKGSILAKCTCPSLASIPTYCHHIAAVLLCMQDLQRQDEHLANDILNLFRNKSRMPSGHQNHVETRTFLNVEFLCKTIHQDNGITLFGIEAKAGIKPLYRIHTLRDFIDNIKRKEPYKL